MQTCLAELGQSPGLPSVVAQQRGSRSAGGSLEARRATPVCQVPAWQTVAFIPMVDTEWLCLEVQPCPQSALMNVSILAIHMYIG